MALKVTHKDTGTGVTHDQWVAEDSHVIDDAYTDSDAIAAAKGDADIADAISKKHARAHAITSAADHSSGATSGKMLKADANGLPVDATNTDAQVAAAVTASHTDQHKIVRKTSDQTVNNSTVYVDDTDLKMAVGANEVWLVEMFLMLNTSAIADFKAQLTCPVGGVVNARQSFPTYSLQAYVGATTQMTETTSSDLTNAGAMFLCIYVGGANAGTLQLQWAQNVADPTNTKVLTNSVLVAHRIL